MTDFTAGRSAASPFATLPVLRASAIDTLARRNSILRYVAAQRGDLDLCGKDSFAEAEVDQWLEYDVMTLGPVAAWISGDVTGATPDAAAAAAKLAAGKLPGILAALEAHLASRTYAVGERISLAVRESGGGAAPALLKHRFCSCAHLYASQDVALASSLVLAVGPADAALTSAPSVRRWLLTLASLLPISGVFALSCPRCSLFPQIPINAPPRL